MNGLGPCLGLKVKTFVSSFWNNLPVASVSALAEPLAQMLRQEGSELNFCKNRLKYGCHNSFSTSKVELAETKVQV